MPSQEEITDLMDELFQKYDTDKSGHLDKLEIIEMLKDTYRDIGATFLSQSHLQDIMNTIDQNGDGEFSYDEVLRY
jgi:Ca2+-binding EF-hand superfamily protein